MERPAPPAGYRAGVRAVAPLAAAVSVFGVSFGILSREAGMGLAAPLVMSLTTFAGSAQFAAASVLSTGGGIAAAAAAAVMLNLRYLPIGISVAPALEGGTLRRVATAQLAVDEAWAVAHVGRGRYDRHRLIGAGLLVLMAWVGGTATGLVGGALLGDPERLGLDAMFPALFLALLAGQIRDRTALLVAGLGAVLALTLIPVAPVGVPIVAASVAALVGLRRSS